MFTRDKGSAGAGKILPRMSNFVFYLPTYETSSIEPRTQLDENLMYWKEMKAEAHDNAGNDKSE